MTFLHFHRLEVYIQENTSDGPRVINIPVKGGYHLFRKKKRVVLTKVTEFPYELRRFPEYQSDKDVVLAAVMQTGFTLKYVRNELNADRDVVLAAVTKDGDALKYAAQELQADKRIVLAAVRQNSLSLMYGSSELQDDEDIVQALYS